MNRENVKKGLIAILFLLALYLLKSPFSFGQKTEPVIQDGHRSDITAFTVDKSGKFLASGGYDGYVFIWDIKKRLKIFENKFKKAIEKLNFPDNPGILLVTSNGQLFLWNFLSGSKSDTISASEYSIDKKMKYIAHSFSNSRWFGISKITDTDFHNPIARAKYEPTSGKGNLNICSLISNENFTKIATIRESEVNFWDLSKLNMDSGKYQEPVLLNTIRLNEIIVDRYMTKVFYRDTVFTIVTFQNYSQNNQIHIISFSDHSSYYKAESIDIPGISNSYGNRYEMKSLDVDDQLTQISVSVYDDEKKMPKIIVWDMKSKKIMHELYNQTGIVKIIPSRNLLFIGNRSILLWDLIRNTKTAEFKSFGEESFPRSIAFSPTEHIIASSSASGVNVWNYAYISRKVTINIKDFRGKYLHFSHDGKILAIHDGWTKIKLFDIHKCSFNDEDEIVSALDLFSFSFSPDDKAMFIIGQEMGESKLTFKEWRIGKSTWEMNKKGNLISSAEVKKYSLKIVPEIGDALNYENTISFSEDGKYASLAFGKLKNPCKTEIIEIKDPISSTVFTLPQGHFCDQINLTNNGTKAVLYNVVSGGYDSLIIFDPVKKSYTFTPYKSIAPGFMKDGYFYSAMYDKQGLLCVNPSDGNSSIKDINPGNKFEINSDSKFLASIDHKGTLDLYNFTDNMKIVSIYNFGSGGYIFITPDNYFFSTKASISQLAVKIKNEVYPIDIFDLQYNRPDIVLERIGLASKELIGSYRKAYFKRLNKMKFEESMFNPEFHMPEIKILNNDSILPTAKSQLLTVKIKAIDSEYQLDRINVWVNDVPIYGINGINLRGQKKNTIDTLLSILLSAGENKVQVSCLNDKGVESLKESFEIRYEPLIHEKPNVHFIGIGVSDYKDPTLNLAYSVKDIHDLAALFKEKNPDIITDTLLNARVTMENLLNLKKKLFDTRIDDIVILSISGHGFLSDSLDFYYGTYDIDYKHPEVKGLSYDDIEWLLDSIPARKKLVLMDACHSGEVDKEEKTKSGETFVNNQKGLTIIPDSSSIGLQNSFDLMQELFTNLSRGNGAVVISAARGQGAALEGKEWNNGVFTHCILFGLKDGKTSVNELKDYVLKEVETLTKGRQQPTSRRDNLENDWVIWQN